MRKLSTKTSKNTPKVAKSGAKWDKNPIKNIVSQSKISKYNLIRD
jgi:hypothetical protein